MFFPKIKVVLHSQQNALNTPEAVSSKLYVHRANVIIETHCNEHLLDTGPLLCAARALRVLSMTRDMTIDCRRCFACALSCVHNAMQDRKDRTDEGRY